jgi:hypothetical protein
MTVSEAIHHEISVSSMEAASFKKDNAWWAKFKQNVEKFYEEHLQWFYKDELDMGLTRCKVEGLLSSKGKDKPMVSELKKRKRCAM